VQGVVQQHVICNAVGGGAPVLPKKPELRSAQMPYLALSDYYTKKIWGRDNLCIIMFGILCFMENYITKREYILKYYIAQVNYFS
jgi:hypothetical protein